MAAWIFVLFAAIGQALADEKINCHFTPDSVSQLFAADQPSWVDKCDRLIVKIGSPLEDGKVRPVSTAIMNHMIEARNGRQGLELLAEVFLRPEHMDPLAEEDYRSTLARSLKIVALDNDLNGVVVNIEDNYIPHPPDFEKQR
ncbi:hypothetical protein HDE_03945 [Halotydeus destructor]|nr:hypothetical protein HDE_03945 [Halotydeus destructor]